MTPKFFKALKYEIKEKLEILENIKAFQDARTKRIPDIIDPKQIREDIEIFEHIQDEWAKSLGVLAAQVDRTSFQLSRSFIRPEERPLVGTPEPVIEELKLPQISAARAEKVRRPLSMMDAKKVLSPRSMLARHRIWMKFRPGLCNYNAGSLVAMFACIS